MEVDKITPYPFAPIELKYKWYHYLFIILMALALCYPNLNKYYIAKGIAGYDSLGIFTDVYQVSASIDDAFVVVGSQFNNDGDYIPAKHQTLDIMIGLKFDDVYLPTNATHWAVPISYYLSFYSDSPSAPAYPCQVSAYFMDEFNGSGFTSYNELIIRPVHPNPWSFDLYYLFGDSWVNSTNFVNQGIGIFKTSPTDMTFKILSASGDGLRQFRTYDYNASLAPKLYIKYELHVKKDEAGDFIEEYRDYYIYAGIYENFYPSQGYYTETDPFGRLDISEGGRKVTFNDLIGTANCNFDRIDLPEEAKTFTVMFKWYVQKITYTTGRTPAYMFKIENGGNYLGITPSFINNTHFEIHIHQDDGTPSAYPMDEDLQEGITLWYKFVNNHTTDKHYSYVWLSEPVDWVTGYDYYKANNMEEPLKDLDWDGVKVLKDYLGTTTDYDGYIDYMRILLGENSTSALGYNVLDEEGDFIITLPTIEECREYIDNLYATGQADTLPYLGDWIISLMGLTGLVMLPLSFIMMGRAIQSGNYADGLHILVLMFSIGISLLIVWLWG